MQASEVPQETPILLGCALALGGLVMGRLVLAGSKLVIPGGQQPRVAWGLAALVPVIGVWILGQVLVPILWSVFESEGELALADEFIMTLLIFAVPGGMIIAKARSAGPAGTRALGLRVGGNLRAIVFGVLAYALLIPALLAAMLLWPAVLLALGVTPQTQAVMLPFFELEGLELVLPLFFAVFVLPFFEELLFRAFLQPVAVRRLRALGGVVLTSLLFAALHGLSALGPVFVLSLIMGGVMQRTGRFAACYCIHALHNGLTLWAVLTFSELREMVDPGAAWLAWLGIG